MATGIRHNVPLHHHHRVDLHEPSMASDRNYHRLHHLRRQHRNVQHRQRSQTRHRHHIINTYRRWHKWEWEFSEEHGLSDITRQDYQRLKDGDTRINHEHIHLPEWNELDHRQKEAFTNTERQCLNAWFNTLDQMVLRIGKEQTSEHTR